MTNVGCAIGILIFIGCYGALLYLAPEPVDPKPLSGLAVVLGIVSFYFGPILISLISQWRAGRRADELSAYHLEVLKEEIRQVDQGGRVIATIRLDEPFQFRDLHREDSDAIYGLYQGKVELNFHTSDPESETILTKFLGLPWPPQAMRIAS
jgi:hypothetical protein